MQEETDQWKLYHNDSILNIFYFAATVLRGQALEAQAHARTGLRLMLEWGTAWDKRLSWDAWVAWTRVLLQTAEAAVESGGGSKGTSLMPIKAFGMLNLGLVKE